MKPNNYLRMLTLALVLGAPAQFARAAATIIINNINAAGVGFNDPTPVAPVGGNSGTTLGQQRLFAFTYAANIWGATLTSSVPIVVRAQFSALSCTATAAVLGSAGATAVFSDFPNAGFVGTWYSFALANKLAGIELSGTPGTAQISANFNVNLGNANCLAGSPFYLGLDGNHGTAIDLVVVLLHEFGHGLGFQTFTSGSTGAQLAGLPSIWDRFLLDSITNKTWVDDTAVERATSALAVNKLVWAGAGVTAAAPSVLTPGTPYLGISGPNAGAAAGNYIVGTASFGALLSTTPVIGQLMPVVDQGAGPGCTPFNAANTLAVSGRIALIDRGVCAFALKAKNAQLAGAIGVVIANNVAGSPPPGLGGSDPSVNVPVVSVTLADATTLRAQLTRRSRTASGVVAEVGINGAQLAGADPLGRLKMFTPNPFQSGSSVSHWDASATRNLLMEPAINGDLTQSLIPPQDLTFTLLQDIGW